MSAVRSNQLWSFQVCLVLNIIVILMATADTKYAKLRTKTTSSKHQLNSTKTTTNHEQFQKSGEEADSGNVATCNTEECVKVAKIIKSSIDTKVDPCDDFFTFSCGNWIKTHPIPKSYNDYSTFTRLSMVIESELKDLLEKPSTLENLPENQALRKAKNFYKSCMDTDRIEKQGAKPMNDYIQEIGSWSICSDGSWNKSRWNIYSRLKKLQRDYYPASPFFSVEVTNDHLNSTKHLIKVKRKNP